MIEFQGRTFDWDGWRFTVVGNKIIARPLIDNRPPGVDLEFYYPDERDDMVIRRVRQIMTTVNIGAYIKSSRIRRELGVDNQFPYNTTTDPVWRDINQPKWVIYGAHGYVYQDFEERV